MKGVNDIMKHIFRTTGLVVAAGLLAGCANYNPVERLATGVVQMTVMPVVDFVATGAKGVQEKGLVGVLDLPNAALNGGLRVPEGIGHMVTGNEPRALGEYNPLAEPRAVTGAGWGALIGYGLNGITPGAGALIGAGAGLIYDATQEKK